MQVGEMVIMNDLEWALLSYYVIYYEKIKKKSCIKQKEALVYIHPVYQVLK